MRFKQLHKPIPGFSLVELMIVLVIMGLLMSIVLPDTFNMMEQHQAQLEQKKLIDFFQEQKYHAYLFETRVSIEFAGTQITSSSGDVLNFEYINAEPQTIYVSKLGAFEQDSVSYYLRMSPVEKVLGDL